MALDGIGSILVVLLIVLRLSGYKLPARPFRIPTQYRLWHLFAVTSATAVLLAVFRYAI